jgi:P27 family predicted phage terminase small subunit
MNVKLLKGETRPSRLGLPEPQPPEAEPEPPEWFTGRHRKVWDAKVADLEAMGISYRADQELLAAFCSAVVLFEDAEVALGLEGLVVPGRDGELHRSPWLLVWRQATSEIARLSNHFGFSPAARARLPVSARVPTSEQDEIFNRLLSP